MYVFLCVCVCGFPDDCLEITLGVLWCWKRTVWARLRLTHSGRTSTKMLTNGTKVGLVVYEADASRRHPFQTSPLCVYVQSLTPLRTFLVVLQTYMHCECTHGASSKHKDMHTQSMIHMQSHTLPTHFPRTLITLHILQSNVTSTPMRFICFHIWSIKQTQPSELKRFCFSFHAMSQGATAHMGETISHI